MPFILDMAPVYKGYTADIGYSGCLGLNPVHDRLLADLRGAPRADPARGARAAPAARDLRGRGPADGPAGLCQPAPRLSLRRHRAQGRPGAGAPLVPHALRVRHPVPEGAGRATRCTATATAGPRCGARTASPTTRRSRGCGRSSRTSDSGARARSSRRSWSSPTPRTREESAFWLDDDLPHVRRWAEEKPHDAGMRRGLARGRARAPGAYGRGRAVRRRAGRPGAAHGGARARLSGQQGGVVRGRRAARRPLPCRAVRRPGPRPVHGPAAAARRLHPGEADGRLPGRRGRGQPGPAGASGRPRLGLGAGLGVRHGRAHRGPDRLLHLDVRARPWTTSGTGSRSGR